MTAEELYRQSLINHNFDMIVAQFPGDMTDPDSLYSLLHSTYAIESGLQNPFGYTNLLMDDLLEQQRRMTGTSRSETATTIQSRLVDECPFTVIGFPDVIRAARTDQFSGWNDAFDPSPVNLLSLNRVNEDATTLRATTPDNRPMANLNPLMSTYRSPTDITDLLYDPLARDYQGTLVPWMADSWEWTGEDPLEMDVTLREDLLWHDDEELTAADVAFTYELLADTSLGSIEEPVPTLRFRGRSSLIDEAIELNDQTVQLQFTDCSQQVALRALTIPILPAHIWRDRTARAELSGVEVGAPTTEALITDAIPPVGSGPLSFGSVMQRQRLVLERFEDHFLHRDTETGLPPTYADGAPFERLRLQFVGSDSSAVDQIANGEADVTVQGVGPDLTPTIGRESDVSLNVNRSSAFYFVGFNTRRPPLTNPRFRRLLSRLLDRTELADSVFNGYVSPAVSPLDGTPWLPPTLTWSNDEPVIGFLGSEGEVDQTQAREAFRAAGYRYNEDGRLLRS